MDAWMVRAGKDGERDEWALSQSVVGGGFREVPSLIGADRARILEILTDALPGAPKGRLTNFRGQLWAFTNRMQVGDLVVLPLKTTTQLAIGRITGPYEYRADNDPGRRHLRPVEWLRTDLPRTAVNQDLLFSLGAALTICEISRNDAAHRIEVLAATGSDPGSRAQAPVDGGAADEFDASAADALDLEQYAMDRLASVLIERFAGHRLAALTAAVLEADGYVCDVSPEGADGGIDILAGRGLLGLDSPRLVVQVKSSPSALDVRPVRELHGVIATHGGDQGLLVAWGGLNKSARREMSTQRFNVRVWEGPDLIEQVTRVYDRLPESIRADLPLKRIWTVVEENSGS